jgi:hypothetical protein
MEVKYVGGEPTKHKSFQERINSIELKLNLESTSKKNIISEIKKISIDKLPYEYDSLSRFLY